MSITTYSDLEKIYKKPQRTHRYKNEEIIPNETLRIPPDMIRILMQRWIEESGINMKTDRCEWCVDYGQGMKDRKHPPILVIITNRPGCFIGKAGEMYDKYIGLFQDLGIVNINLLESGRVLTAI